MVLINYRAASSAVLKQPELTGFFDSTLLLNIVFYHLFVHEFGQIKGGRSASPEALTSGKLVV